MREEAGRARSRPRALLRSLRPAQWVKNLFVLVPLVFAHRLDRAADSGAALCSAFAAFCAAASAVYLLNDMRDREADRLHPLKRLRPIAAGELGGGAALGASLVLAAGAAASPGGGPRSVRAGSESTSR